MSVPEKLDTGTCQGIEFDVLSFMILGKQIEAEENGTPFDTELLSKRMDMLLEEFKELILAIVWKDHVEIADALVDIPWIAIGTLFKMYGPEKALEIIDVISTSNLSKVDGSLGETTWNGIGKVMKPEGWIDPKPQIRAILERQE